ncbi:LolA family protein [Marinigracilibium pacificum]|uniref:Outer membrane lipoprotein carrier protein LolA n=1 Tax=Marinigracilibium pacificum TaxID=2729599 RepID=A0A848J079_9BACT|nr:outer membrane lipoprotein carrier protein LolA [Marinigracilibium pacificum]NMM47884.1 outer membrane lipoprotein carrier protein LolA [Marinigracilibium pacificum]
MKKLLILILFFNYVSLIIAQNDFVKVADLANFKTELSKKTSSIKSIHADFTQMKHMQILAEPLKSSGIIRYKAENKVKWSYTSPYKYEIILNGKDIIINDDGNVNAFSVGSSEMFSEMNDLIVNSVQGDVLDEKRFKISCFENKSYYKVELVPIDKKKIGAFFTKVVVYFEKADYSVSSVEMYEQGGDHTDIKFENKNFNQSISDAIFTAN